MSIVECFDAAAAKAYLKRSRIEFILWIVSFAVFTATAVSLFAIYGAHSTASSAKVLLVLAISFALVDIGGLAGSVSSGLRYVRAERTVVDSGQYVRDVATTRAATAYDELSREVKEVLFRAEGFYFGDIDTPYLMRTIGSNRYSSNYQTSLLYVDGSYLAYRSAIFSLTSQEERVLNGSIPFDLISSIVIIKPNGIDLFCPHLKVVFGSQCMLFALDADAEYGESLVTLQSTVFAAE